MEPSTFLLLMCSVILQTNSIPNDTTLPVKIPSSNNRTCSSTYGIEIAAVQHAIEIVNYHLNNNYGPPCKCSRSSTWSRVAYLNMTNITQSCPSNWTLIETPVRGCKSGSDLQGCDSAFFPTSFSYNRVCGRVTGYQKGTTDGFDFTIGSANTIEEEYVDGLSLTHGEAGSRQHIWTFVSAGYEDYPTYQTTYNCPCTNINYHWTHQVPAFIGNNYFCDTGNPGIKNKTLVFSSNPLWDGIGCSQTSTCCQFNQPPWFCTTLPNSTRDELELRICKDQSSQDEDNVIALVEIYVAHD